MLPQQKIELCRDLIVIRKKLAWAAQGRRESVLEFGNRMRLLLEAYNNAGKIAQVEFIEIFENTKHREDLAIYTFLRGLSPEVKRYTCKPEIYKSLYQAIRHADQIQMHLNDLQCMRRMSIMTLGSL